MRLISYLSKNSNKKEEIFRLIIRPDFAEDIDKVREKFNINSNDFELLNSETEQLWVLHMEDFNLRRAVKGLIKRYNVSPRWLNIITQYIIDANFVPPNDIDPDGPRLEKNFLEKRPTDHPEYSLIINNETTLNDIKIAWPKIQKELDRKRKNKRKPWIEFWRDYEIFKLASKGNDIATIHRKILSKLGRDLDYGNIKKIESDFRQRLKIPKKYRKSKLKTSNKKLPILG